MQRVRRHNLAYTGLLGSCLVVALALSWTRLAAQLDNDVYDWMFQLYRPALQEPQSILLSIDEETLQSSGGMRGLTRSVAEGLELLRPAAPKSVAIDVILADGGAPEDDARLEAAVRDTPKVVLACELLPKQDSWEEPLPGLRKWAAAVGHVYAEPDPVSREILLEKATTRDRRWALSLEAFRVSRGAEILEAPEDLQVGGITIPASRANFRAMRIRYLPPDRAVPRVSLIQLRNNPGLARLFADKTVFVGVTAQTAGDRLMTPYSFGVPMPGVEIHANAFETIAQRQFLTDAPQWQVVFLSLMLVIAAGTAFAFLSGWQANLAAFAVLGVAQVVPYLFFTHRIVLPYSPLVFSAWFSVLAAAAFRHFVVRRRLRTSEAETVRYQQAMHFVTHEMRTPLTAIQGSSELISRYNMSEEKRKQIALLINSESKRLAHMIEMFLSVERLSAGQLQLAKENFPVWNLMTGCVERVRPIADRKQIRITMEPASEDTIIGDRELMEYAFYNLLTNAVKYSPPHTEVKLYGGRRGGQIQISVRDQGIGMDQKEVGKIFQKFYRTRKAEDSGEPGTGIGLSIVEQIVTQHGGTIQVVSHPGRGSCFTLLLPAPVSACLAEQH